MDNKTLTALRESIYDAVHSADSIQFEQAYKGVIPAAKDYDGNG